MSLKSNLCLLNEAKFLILCVFYFYTEDVTLPPGRMLAACRMHLIYFLFHMGPLLSVAQCMKGSVLYYFFHVYLFILEGKFL